HAVTSGTGRQLVNDGLGRLNAAGKTGTSNDGRDSWFAGWTGDHLAVAWVGNDQNEQTGLYGATGAMRVWSGVFSHLPSAPLRVGNEGLDWQWVLQCNAPDAECAGVRRFAFVDGFAPPYVACASYTPTDPFALPDAAAPQDPAGSDTRRRGWREWFGFGRREPAPEPAAPSPADAPPASPSPPEQPE